MANAIDYIEVSRAGVSYPADLKLKIGAASLLLNELEAIDLRDKLTWVLERRRCPECCSEPCICNDVVYEGFTRKALQDAFKVIQDAEDWRAPIYSKVYRSDLKATLASICYFTGTVAKVLGDFTGRDKVTVQSPGYRNGPAGDH